MVSFGLSGCADGSESSTSSESGSGTTTDDGSDSSDGRGTGLASTGDMDETDQAVMWEATLTVDPNADWPSALEVATSPSGQTYVLVADSESGPILFAFSPEGETVWSYALDNDDVEHTELVATEDHVAVGVLTSIGAIGRAYHYTVLNRDGSLHSTDSGATNSRSIGLALAGENLVLSTSGATEFSEGTAEAAVVRAYRLGTSEPAWTWRRPGLEGASSGDAVVILPDGGIAVAGKERGPRESGARPQLGWPTLAQRRNRLGPAPRPGRTHRHRIGG